MTTLRTIAREINNVIFTSFCVFIIVWMFSGYDIVPALKTLGMNTALLERVIVSYEIYTDDHYRCYERINYVGNTLEDRQVLDNCVLSLALDVENESYIVPLLMVWMNINRETAETYTTYLYNTLVTTDVYYGEG